jgi:hypothetical protein
MRAVSIPYFHPDHALRSASSISSLPESIRNRFSDLPPQNVRLRDIERIFSKEPGVYLCQRTDIADLVEYDKEKGVEVWSAGPWGAFGHRDGQVGVEISPKGSGLQS